MINILHGGRGASSSSAFSLSFDDKPKGKDVSKSDLPARVNRMFNGNEMSEAETLRRFTEMFKDDKKEHAFVVDKEGFVTEFRHGGKNYVTTTKNSRGQLLIHNHPNSSNFSGADLKTFVTSKQRGVVAVGKNGSYMITTTGRFNATGFKNMITSVGTIKGKDYNDAVSKLLKKNAKKYGYKFTYTTH